MAFVKLDTGVLDSTLWIDRPCREIFITALLMAEPLELGEPLDQFEVRSLTKTGFVVPPGWYGFVRAAGVGIANRALMDMEIGLNALQRLGDIDPESRSKEHEGRRLVRVDGGYIILNYFKYRDRDHTAAERQQRLRERKKNIAKGPLLNDEEWKSVVAFYNGMCAYCGTEKWRDIDHVFPTSKGGKHEISNVVPACASCNSTKRAEIWEVPRKHPYMLRVTSRNEAVTSRIADADADADADAEGREKNQEKRVAVPAKPKKPPKENSASRIPDDFSLTPERRAVAEAERINPDRTFAKFVDYWRAASGAKARKVDWEATWRNWCRNDRDRQPYQGRQREMQPEPREFCK